MARSMAASHLRSALDIEEDATESTEELLPHQKESWCAHKRAASAALVAGALLACAVLAWSFAPDAAGANAPPVAKPVTVRQLLEGPELTDVVTDNFMNLGHGYLSPVQRGEVRAAVAENLANISGSIRARLPGDHAKFDLLQLSEVQKGSALRLLRFYSDPRVLRLGNAMAEASAQAKAEGGNRQTIKSRISEKLRPQVRELRELCDDIVPGSGKHMDFDAADFDDLAPAQTVDKWNLKVEMTPPKVSGRSPSAAGGLLAARRLTARDTHSGTRDQATTVLQHLHGMIGEPMPTAPARMLLFDHQKEVESTTTGWERFEKCVMDNMGKLPDMFQCLMTNCKRAMTWLMQKLHLGDMMEKMMSSSTGR